MQNIDEVPIDIGTKMFSGLRHYNNTQWFVFAEYIDNSIQSYIDNEEELKELYKGKFQLEVDIILNVENDLITIKDNAAGINSEKYISAFKLGNTPTDTSGLNEFGMGMKTASVWLSDIWKVKTTALGENEERETEFNLNAVTKNESKSLKTIRKPRNKNEHGTEIILTELSFNAPKSSNAGSVPKIKNHLSSIYRKFIRNGMLKLSFNGQPLSYKDPKILKAPYFKDKNGESITWRKEIDFTYKEKSVSGFIGVLETMSNTKTNGFSLFRRGRVIEGSGDEKYKPKELCGNIGSPRYKRMFGELELDGFEVSFNKGSFIEGESLKEFMKLLKFEINHRDFDLYGQAENYRKPRDKDDDKIIAKKLVKAIKKSEKKVVKLPIKIDETEESRKLDNIEIFAEQTEEITIEDTTYILKYKLISDESISKLYDLEEEYEDQNIKKLSFKINIGHEFFNQFRDIFVGPTDYQPVISIIKTLVISEKMSKDQGTTAGYNIRVNLNRYLTNI